jgi:hypothetical protein
MGQLAERISEIIDYAGNFDEMLERARSTKNYYNEIGRNFMGKLKEARPGFRNNLFQSLIEAFSRCNGLISNLPW